MFVLFCPWPYISSLEVKKLLFPILPLGNKPRIINKTLSFLRDPAYLHSKGKKKTTMESNASSMARVLLILSVIFTLFSSSNGVVGGAFEENFSKSCPGTHFKTSKDGQIWYLTLDQVSGD